jgi:hypothetical protein
VLGYDGGRARLFAALTQVDQALVRQTPLDELERVPVAAANPRAPAARSARHLRGDGGTDRVAKAHRRAHPDVPVDLTSDAQIGKV